MVSSEQVSFLRGLKGAAASIVLALVLTGSSLKGMELQMVTGYSDKPISQGLALLELHGLVQFNGRTNGWSFRGDVQLPLFPTASLGGRHESDPGALPDRVESDDVGSRNISDFTVPSSSVGDYSGKVIRDEEAEEGESDRSFSVREWLVRAGVGRRSPKMREIVALGLDPGYVQAWVMEFEWFQRELERRPGERVNGRSRFSTGTLIRILLDGDVAPPIRCDLCLERSSSCYCDVIQS